MATGETSNHKSSRELTSPNLLCVDETKRPRANSDPVGLHMALSSVPEIMVTGEDGGEGQAEDDEFDSYLIPPSPRRRANTCPEDMFRLNKGRPPTPPPTDLHVMKSPGGKRFSFNFTAKDLNGISFAHHKLSKVSEEKPESPQKGTSSSMSTSGPTSSSCLQSADNPLHQGRHGCQNSKVRTDGKTLSNLSSGQTNGQSETAVNECSCDQTVRQRLGDLTVKEQNVAVSPTNNNDKSSTEETDAISSRPESCRSKDTARDNVDSARLKAF